MFARSLILEGQSDTIAMTISINGANSTYISQPFNCAPYKQLAIVKNSPNWLNDYNYNNINNLNAFSQFYLEFNTFLTGINVSCQVSKFRCVLTTLQSNFIAGSRGTAYIGQISLLDGITNTTDIIASPAIKIYVGDIPFAFSLDGPIYPGVIPITNSNIPSFFPQKATNQMDAIVFQGQVNPAIIFVNKKSRPFLPAYTKDDVYGFAINNMDPNKDVNISTIDNIEKSAQVLSLIYEPQPLIFVKSGLNANIINLTNTQYRICQFIVTPQSAKMYDTAFFLYSTDLDSQFDLDIVRYSPQFPYGFNRYGSIFNYNISGYMPPHSTVCKSTFLAYDKLILNNYYKIYSTLNSFYGVLSPDIRAPDIVNISYNRLSTYSYLVTINAWDDLSGVHLIKFNNDIYSSEYSLTTLDRGSAGQTSRFQFEYNVFGLETLVPKIQIIDHAFNIYTIKNLNIANFNLLMIPDLPRINDFDASELTYFKFSSNNVDTSNGFVNVTLNFKTKANDPTLQPRFTYFVSNNFASLSPNAIGNYLSFEGAYDMASSMYKIDFYLHPYRLNGTLIYSLGGLKPFAESSSYITYFGDDALLNYRSKVADEFPPAINDITTLETRPISFLPAVDGSAKISLTCSDWDFTPYQVYINASNRIEGNEKTGKYNVTAVIDGLCRSQSYNITGVTLIDSAGWISSTDSRLSPINPMFGLQSTPINVVCIPTTLDNTPPTLTSFSYTLSSNDSSSQSRQLVVRLTVSDSGSGISPRHNAVVNLWTDQYRFITMHTDRYLDNGRVLSYIGTTTLPYGFGANGIQFSVDGVTDNQLNICSFKAEDINAVGSPYFVNSTFSQTPLLTSASPISRAGGQLTIKGRALGTSDIQILINYGDGTPVSKVTPIFISNILVVIQILPIPLQPFITIQAQTTYGYSNTFQIIPIDLPNTTPQPTPTPTQTTKPNNPVCPGTPVCSGQGDCTPTGCLCRANWVGPECNSEIIIIPKPEPNPSTPTIITNASSIISILAIRELSPTSEIIHEYKLKDSDWVLTTSSNANTNIFNSSASYTYTTVFQSNVSISIIVQWYENATNITFAGQSIALSPSSLKYLISVGSYNFTSSLHTLQLVMGAYISGEDSSCSSKQAGIDQNNDLKWLRLNIDNKSLYGRFSEYGYVDGRVQPVTNTLLKNDAQYIPESTRESAQSYIGINIPNYANGVLLDPDFSNIVNIDDPSNEFDQICKGNSGIRMSIIAGIVVACIVFIALLVTGVIVLEKNSNIRLKIASILDPK
ncbi:hypothetical protein PPL_03227 [Heterostelium album PN500]|uniref:EGF-like domain-containing protein n=1 Tax=Heterostelium pallidum (strain ATCC 26659 / Pp 5 / PN500) TaxID=670386 RepID=D3B4A5_HETP5|nr:hypothetical protein PPL_03227 [Heterostelium album PN500]EFA84153.1 hypothetical protein PPL_03227 [Heterostelium album PN500]|eukprot:XP_020436270.1 hypothetical protein PPL_03227 [Heterostelium album PN500]